METITSCGQTHIGRRKSNQDAYCVLPKLGLYAVADGMGGYQGGEIASQLALEKLTEFYQRYAADREATWPYKLDRRLTLAENMVDVAVRLANGAITARRMGPLAKMGTTLAMIYVCPYETKIDNQGKKQREMIIGHIGDSRIYRQRAGTLQQMTRDHSLYEQLRDVGADLPPLEQFTHGNVITKALGVEPKARPDLRIEQGRSGDRFLICSDGLTGPVADARLNELLSIPDPQQACHALIRAAYDAGGTDNITAILVDFA